VSSIEQDTDTPFQEVHEPGHPDADENGMVRYPNVNAVREYTDLITAMRAYEANIGVMESMEQMASQALRLAE
jgi:flagellar basal-body rod protein FlgC